MTPSGSLPKKPPQESSPPYWSWPASRVLKEVHSDEAGLTSAEARQRLKRYGYNRLQAGPERSAIRLFLGQFTSPILLILFAAVGLSLFLGDRTDALIILAIILMSGLLSYRQEKGASDTVRRLLASVQVSVSVLRDGKQQDISFTETVPGDIVLLAAGGIVPGDGLILESKDLFVDEATLTGESFPVDKAPGLIPPDAPLARRTNTLLMGTHIVSGLAKAVLVRTGKDTEFGRVSERLRLRPPETEFERGIRRFGYFLMEVTMILLLVIFALNVFLAKPILDSFLFALALAIGLTPQLLPAIISINLAHGASRMASRRVVVKRLAAIENFGSMTVLCSDKTGTLTEGSVRVYSAEDVHGQHSDRILFLAACNAHFESGFANPLDLALLSQSPRDFSVYSKLDEIPYDFSRKRLSVLLRGERGSLLLTKGALPSILAVCRTAETSEGAVVPLDQVRREVLSRYDDLSAGGFRCLGLAQRDLGAVQTVADADEREMCFLGIVSFVDPVKEGSGQTISGLKDIGVQLKIITGDNARVAAEVSRRVGMESARIVTGPELRKLSDEALLRVAEGTDVFAEVEPNQKEHLILALKKAGQVVGFLGDGINDAPALHAADVGISVENAVDVAKSAADIILLEKDLAVLGEGIRQGRLTFANTLKYVFMATSANFGNMFSMAGASLFLPFLPLLPKQILLVNFLTDIPEMTIAGDAVDAEITARPRRWDFKFIRNFMVTFGPLSSLFDFLTFVVLLLFLRADATAFRTGWFMESVVSASLIVLVVRTRRLFFRSQPGRALSLATLLVAVATLVLPYTPLAPFLSFGRLPWTFFPALALVLILYVTGAEAMKYLFYRRIIPKESL